MVHQEGGDGKWKEKRRAGRKMRAHQLTPPLCFKTCSANPLCKVAGRN
jgi:hypothetical protein